MSLTRLQAAKRAFAEKDKGGKGKGKKLVPLEREIRFACLFPPEHSHCSAQPMKDWSAVLQIWDGGEMEIHLGGYYIKY
jgi:hypothetical protein